MASQSSSILEVRSLCKSYDDGRIEALRGVDLAISAGEYLTISGPSGSGKSTLLQLLGGLDTPTTGEVLFKNEKLGSAIDLDTYRSRSVGFIFQAFHLLPTLRVDRDHGPKQQEQSRGTGNSNELHSNPLY